MALNAAQIQARIDSLRTARDSGVLIVRHGDTSTQFRSLEEMSAIIADLEGQLGTVNGTVRRSRVSYIRQNTKAFGC